jgi:glycosyltransferase involved in cell wall biosynthesis
VEGYSLAEGLPFSQIGQNDRGRTEDQKLVAVVLLIEPRPRSVTYRRYREPMSGRTLLEHCLDAITEAARGSPVGVIVFDSEEESQVAKLASGFDCSVHLSQETTDVAALCAYSAHTGVQHVAALALEYILGPSDALPRLLRHHLSCGNDISTMDGLPSTVTPVVFRRSFIETLSLAQLPGLTVDCWSGAKLLRQLGACDRIPGFTFSFQPLDARRVYQLPEAGLPHCASLEFPESIAAARVTLERLKASRDTEQGPFSFLTMWHAETVRAREEMKSTTSEGIATPLSKPRRDKPRILYVSNGAGFSGAEQSLCQLVGQISTNVFEKTALVSLEGEFTNRLRKLDVNVICHNREFAEPTLDNLMYVLQVCRSLQPDLIHLNGLDGFPMIVVSRIMNVPLVFHLRNGVTGQYSEYVHAAEQVIAVSEFLKKSALELGVSEDVIRVVYDEVDATLFRRGVYSREESRELLGIPAGSRIVAMIARLVPYKRHDVMLRAMEILRTNIPDIHLLLVGEIFEKSEYSRTVLSRLNEPRLKGAITWVPFIRDIRKVHSAADVLVLCSNGEGLGRCIVEAMAMEVPVVVTSSGGGQEIVARAKSGLVIEDDNPAELASAIERLLTHSGLSKDCGAAGRTFVTELLTSEQAALSVMAIYNHLLDAPPRSKPSAQG